MSDARRGGSVSLQSCQKHEIFWVKAAIVGNTVATGALGVGACMGRLDGSKGAVMKHMIPLLIVSFFLVNVVSGYLNADASSANPNALKSDARTSVDRPLAWRLPRPLLHDERGG